MKPYYIGAIITENIKEGTASIKLETMPLEDMSKIQAHLSETSLSHLNKHPDFESTRVILQIVGTVTPPSPTFTPVTTDNTKKSN